MNDNLRQEDFVNERVEQLKVEAFQEKYAFLGLSGEAVIKLVRDMREFGSDPLNAVLKNNKSLSLNITQAQLTQLISVSTLSYVTREGSTALSTAMRETVEGGINLSLAQWKSLLAGCERVKLLEQEFDNLYLYVKNIEAFKNWDKECVDLFKKHFSTHYIDNKGCNALAIFYFAAFKKQIVNDELWSYMIDSSDLGVLSQVVSPKKEVDVLSLFIHSYNLYKPTMAQWQRILHEANSPGNRLGELYMALSRDCDLPQNVWKVLFKSLKIGSENDLLPLYMEKCRKLNLLIDDNDFAAIAQGNYNVQSVLNYVNDLPLSQQKILLNEILQKKELRDIKLVDIISKNERLPHFYIEALIEHCDLTGSVAGETLLMWAWKNTSVVNKSELLDSISDVDIKNYYLKRAYIFRENTVFDKLLKKVNLNEKNDWQENILSHLLPQASEIPEKILLRIIKVLGARSADINGNTILDRALEENLQLSSNIWSALVGQSRFTSKTQKLLESTKSNIGPEHLKVLNYPYFYKLLRVLGYKNSGLYRKNISEETFCEKMQNIIHAVDINKEEHKMLFNIFNQLIELKINEKYLSKEDAIKVIYEYPRIIENLLGETQSVTRREIFNTLIQSLQSNIEAISNSLLANKEKELKVLHRYLKSGK